MRLFCRVEGGDACCKLYRLPVVTRGAEPQEGGGIARAWIVDPKIYPGIPMPVSEGTMVAKGGRFIKILFCFCVVTSGRFC